MITEHQKLAHETIFSNTFSDRFNICLNTLPISWGKKSLQEAGSPIQSNHFYGDPGFWSKFLMKILNFLFLLPLISARMPPQRGEAFKKPVKTLQLSKQFLWNVINFANVIQHWQLNNYRFGTDHIHVW